MALSSEENRIHVSPEGPAKTFTGDEVVISGISGIFPKSENTTQFLENLYNNVDMVSEIDFHFYHPEVPRHMGHIDSFSKFDAQFFRVNYHQAYAMEPVSRKLLEQAYMAIYDSGINPLALKGKKVGVFIGHSYSDTSNVGMYHITKQKGSILSGCGKSMFSNRISYWIDAKGPSYTLDAENASSMICLEHAYNAMTIGECEAVIVGGGNHCRLPELGLNLRKGGMACIDGKTKCFDANGDGPVRSEAINCIFLQKAKDAKRIYAQLYYTEVNYGLNKGDQFLPVRKSEYITQFLENFYSNTNVSPEQVEYVEANGAAIAEADKNELKAIGNVFTKCRHKPILVGSVKSNMGNAEPASGLCAVTKACLAFKNGKLPANLHYTEPFDIPEIKQGKVRVLNKNESFNRGFIAVNNFSVNGTNCHALLRGYYKEKDTSKYKTSIPRLVLVSGRQDDCVNHVLNTLKSQPIDPEVIGMLHNIYQIDTPGHTSRGYTILDTNEHNETVSLSQGADYYPGVKRPLCLVFSGMGSQWPGMAADLMKIPIFAEIMQICQKALEPFGIDLIRVITEPDKAMFDYMLNCFIGISAVQIGLSKVLKEIGLVADNIIGHSQGEMCCGYWDDGLTIEETIISAYHRGMVATETPFEKGSMAAVGLGYKDLTPLLPPEIDVACRNSHESATISGPVNILKKFVSELSNRGIFAREIPNATVAFHSRYIQCAGPVLLEKLKSVIKNPKLRSEKWISSSVPQDRWHEDVARYCSAEYHTNNLKNPVYFEDAAQLIPDNAVVVEVAPHGLLQAILKRSHPECTHIPLTKRGHENQLKFLLEAIGKLYQEGYNLKIENLYPKIEYPVSTDTQMISHFVDWEHSEEWPKLYGNYSKNSKTTTSRQLIMSVHDDEFKYITGHIRDGNNIFPESALIFLIWDTLANYKGVSYKDMSVVFHDVQFFEESIILADEPLKLNFMLNKGNNYFEITQEKVVVATGFIAEINKVKFEVVKKEDEDQTNEFEKEIILNSEDLYKYLHARGLTYKGEFQSIKSTNFKRNKALIKWNENWVSLLDSIIQLNILAKDSEGISVPKIIKKLTISIDEFNMAEPVEVDGLKCFNAEYYSVPDITRCAGIEIKQLYFDEKLVKQQEPDVLEPLVFVPHSIAEEVNMETALRVNLQIIADNVLGEGIRATEISMDQNSSISNVIKDVAQYIPKACVEIQTVEWKNVGKSLDSSNVFILLTWFKNGTDVEEVLRNISKDSFILTFEESDLKIGYFNVISSINVHKKNLLLLKKKDDSYKNNVTYMKIKNDENFSWVPTLNSNLEKVNKVVLVFQKQPNCGLIGLVKSLKKKYSNKIGLVIVDDFVTPSFDEKLPFYEKQLEKNLVINILQKGQWGSYYYLENQTSMNVQNMKLITAVPGDINSLKWSESAPVASKNFVQVCYAGPSNRDSQRAVGMIDNDGNGLGFDFSGFDAYGDRVMGLISSGAIASTVQADPHLLWQVPDYWSLEDAATVPLPYVLACYCLAIKAQLRKGQSIFVNGGAGAFGQAVISLALSLDCAVYTSVSNEEKKLFLLNLFAKLDESNVTLTQNGNFYIQVKINTKGKGCDFVINSASGYLREAAMKCTAPNGLFLDLNEFDWKMNSPFGMSYVQQDRSYASISLSSIFKMESLEDRKTIQRILAEGIKNGSVRPISRVVYPTNEVARAFRLLASYRHRGRVLLKMRNAEIPTKCLGVIPRVTYSSKGTYIIVCDQSELGIELAHQLVKRGVRQIMLHLKSKAVSGYMQLRFASWMKLGTKIKISTENLHLDKNCAQFLNEATKLGQIHGIFIVQTSNLRSEQWRREDFVKKHEEVSSVVIKLDVISRNNCSELSQFVVVSRTSQNAVDEYATSVSDRVCQERKKIGLPATSLRIESMEEFQSQPENLNNKIKPQNIATVLSALERSIKQNLSSTITYNLKKQGDSEIVDKVLRCLNISNLDEIESKTLVKDLITNDIQLEELKSILKYAYKPKYNVKKLTRMTVSSLKSLAAKCTEQNNAYNSKLGAFYTFVDQDEYIATKDIITMKTIVNKHGETNELDKNATHVLLIPGFEGHHHVFTSICERLKTRAVTLQLGPDVITHSIKEMANSILELIKKTFVFKSKFYLLGYSFGVNIALEVAALLEKEGHTGLVYCLDSSPDAMKVHLDAFIGKKTDSELQNNILEHFFRLMSGENSTEISETVGKLNNWSDKVEVFINKLKKHASFTHEYVRNVLESAYRRINLAYNYNPSLRLESKLVLLKGLPHPDSANLDSDYGLSKYTKKPVEVINLVRDHATAPRDCRISNIVNKFIDPELLETSNSNYVEICKAK